MPETVIVTTTDLEPAVRLRDAFQEGGLRVELLTTHETVADVAEPVLLVLTGGVHDRRSRALVAAAGERDVPVLALASDPLEATPEAAHRLGIGEVLAKPIDIQEAVLVGRRLIDRARFRAITGIVGDTEAMREVVERVVQIAPVAATVLITGESGTGKELVARGIHALSPRRHQRFIAANVAAFPDTLLESELFGHEKGSFTGAVAQRKGFFELAHRGTLFLDEIGEMPAATQSKLLRVLEEREFMRVGGEESISVDVRVIAATNQDLRHLVERGSFRRDLYYRLNVLSIHMPPLRDRVHDIPILIQRFIRSASAEHDRPQVSISPAALDILMRYDWPGNVRELRNLVESMVVLSPGRTVEPSDIPLAIRDGRASRLLPVHVPTPPVTTGEGTAPELEFIFHTMLQMRIDMEELRRQFDEFRHRQEAGRPPLALPAYSYPFVAEGARHRSAGSIEDAVVHDEAESGSGEDREDEGVVVFRPGMSMQDMEREAIIAVLKEVHGNRRRAAEMLGIGERTLYRKIKEYGIPL